MWRNTEIHGDLEETWRQEYRREHRDSSTQRMMELDRCLAAMIQEIENRRADQLQIKVAEMLQQQEDRKAKEEKKEE